MTHGSHWSVGLCMEVGIESVQHTHTQTQSVKEITVFTPSFFLLSVFHNWEQVLIESHSRFFLKIQFNSNPFLLVLSSWRLSKPSAALSQVQQIKYLLHIHSKAK